MSWGVTASVRNPAIFAGLGFLLPHFLRQFSGRFLLSRIGPASFDWVGADLGQGQRPQLVIANGALNVEHSDQEWMEMVALACDMVMTCVDESGLSSHSPCDIRIAVCMLSP